jgi:hypothetical protein
VCRGIRKLLGSQRQRPVSIPRQGASQVRRIQREGDRRARPLRAVMDRPGGEAVALLDIIPRGEWYRDVQDWLGLDCVVGGPGAGLAERKRSGESGQRHGLG